MTIAQLLSINGAQVPRYITVGGRTVFGPVTSTPAGLVHPTHGRVTPVMPHKFHGGAVQVESDEGPWWDDESSLDLHQAAMGDAFPGFEFVPAQGESAPGWVGDVDTGRGVFRVSVTLRRDRGLPRIRVVSGQALGRYVAGRFVHSPHLYLDGSLCVADAADWDASVHTAATASAWAAHWLAAFTEWRFTLKWPVDGFEPDAA